MAIIASENMVLDIANECSAAPAIVHFHSEATALALRRPPQRRFYPLATIRGAGCTSL